jgi:SAM-dependent methyltransferase
MLDMPDVRRAKSAKKLLDFSRGQLRPEPNSRPKDSEDGDGPVDASLIMSSLAIDAAPKIEDNYDYTILDEFRSSKHCPAPTRVVNTGCGGGEAAVYFAKLGFKVVGIDSDRVAVGLARERAWLAGQDVDFMVGDLFETPNLLPAESFGLAIDRGAFYRLEDDRDRQRYLANIRRLLFQGGVLLLSAGFFPFDDKSGKKAPPRGGTKLLLAREGGVVVNELRQAGFDLMHRILRKTADSGDYGELLLYLKK